MDKLLHEYSGPFEVMEKCGPETYRVQNLDPPYEQQKVNSHRMKKYHVRVGDDEEIEDMIKRRYEGGPSRPEPMDEGHFEEKPSPVELIEESTSGEVSAATAPEETVESDDEQMSEEEYETPTEGEEDILPLRPRPRT